MAVDALLTFDLSRSLPLSLVLQRAILLPFAGYLKPTFVRIRKKSKC
jgi:hypothetical protein